MSTAVEESLGRITAHRDAIVGGQTKLGPGQPLNFSPALSPGQGLAQGDLNLVMANEVPESYKLRENGSGQLVPGNTIGAKHVVTDPTAVEIYDPPGFGPAYDDLKGPFIKVNRDTVIGHPVHGDISVPAGVCIECLYQRVWDQELKKERRQRD